MPPPARIPRPGGVASAKPRRGKPAALPMTRAPRPSPHTPARAQPLSPRTRARAQQCALSPHEPRDRALLPSTRAATRPAPRTNYLLPHQVYTPTLPPLARFFVAQLLPNQNKSFISPALPSVFGTKVPCLDWGGQPLLPAQRARNCAAHHHTSPATVPHPPQARAQQLCPPTR